MTNRRAFLTSSAAVTATLGASRVWSAPARADLVITNANVITMDSGNPEAAAMAVRGETLLAVGSNEEVEQYAGVGTRKFDAAGMTVTPGFIDAHSHPLMVNEATGVNVNLRRIDEVKAALRAKAEDTPAGSWVEGVMYDDTKFEEGRPLNKWDLDEAVPDHPVFVGHRGGHTAVVNSKAFEVAGVTMATEDPRGGKFYRAEGEFTGKVAELALGVFRGSGTWPVVDRNTRSRAATLISKRMAAAGLTSTTDAYGELDGLIAYQDALAADDLHFRLSFMPGGNSEVYAGLKQAGVQSGFGNHMLRIGAVKFSADGSASERTMRMSTPFAGRDNDYGILTMNQNEIDAAVDDAVAHQFRVGIHANGDVAIAMVLKAYERVLKNWAGPNPRFRIEHCSLINEDLLRRIKKTGVVPTPFYTYAHYHGNKWLDYGREKMQSMFAHRSFLDAGIPVAPASDYAPGPYEPMMALQSMVTRKDMQGRLWGESQRIGIEEALKVCTVNGAYASFEEDTKGSLTPGKLADYVLLSQDPRKTDPEELQQIKVMQTVLGGRVTFEA